MNACPKCKEFRPTNKAHFTCGPYEYVGDLCDECAGNFANLVLPVFRMYPIDAALRDLQARLEEDPEWSEVLQSFVD